MKRLYVLFFFCTVSQHSVATEQPEMPLHHQSQHNIPFINHLNQHIADAQHHLSCDSYADKSAAEIWHSAHIHVSWNDLKDDSLSYHQLLIANSETMPCDKHNTPISAWLLSEAQECTSFEYIQSIVSCTALLFKKEELSQEQLGCIMQKHRAIGLETQNKKMLEQQACMNSLATTINEYNDEANNELRNNLTELLAAYEKQLLINEELTQQNNKLTETQKLNKQQLQETTDQRDSLQQINKTTQKGNKQLKEQNEALQQHVQSLQGHTQSLEKKTQELQKELEIQQELLEQENIVAEKKINDLTSITELIPALKQQLSSADTAILELKSNIEKMTKKLKDLSEKHQKLIKKNTSDESQKTVPTQADIFDEAKQNLSDLNSILETYQTNINERQIPLSALQTKTDTLEQTIKDFKETNTSLKKTNKNLSWQNTCLKATLFGIILFIIARYWLQHTPLHNSC